MQTFKVTEEGMLELFRRGEFRKTSCPFFNREANGQAYFISCGDWCPHFGEVEDQGNQQRLVLTCGNGVELYNTPEEDPEAF